MLDGQPLGLGVTTPYVVTRSDGVQRKLNEGLVSSLFVADRDEETGEGSAAGLALADRIQWLASRTGGQRALSTAAFGPAGATKVSNLVSRLRSGVVHGMHSDTLAALVNAARERGQPIESEWLRTGGGPQFVADVEPSRTVAYDDPHVHRPTALAVLRGLVDAETIEAVRTMSTKSTKELSVDEWVDIGRDLQRTRNRVRTELESSREVPPTPNLSAPALAAARLRGTKKKR